MRKKSLVFYAAIIPALILASCTRDDIDIIGAWERQIDEYIVQLNFDTDETFNLEVGERSRTINGKYDVRGDVLLLTDDDCGEIEGKYRVDMQGETAKFSVLNDTCEGRVEVVEGEWRIVGNQ